MTKDDFEEFNRHCRGCELVVLADIGTQTILGAQSTFKLGQERFDALCAAATRVFALPVTTRARLLRPSGQSLFWRAAPGASEALCAVGGPALNACSFFEAAETFMTAGAE